MYRYERPKKNAPKEIQPAKKSLINRILHGASSIILPNPLAQAANAMIDHFIKDPANFDDNDADEPRLSVATERARLTLLASLLKETVIPMERYMNPEGFHLLNQDIRSLN